jgi:hypothetical protein
MIPITVTIRSYQYIPSLNKLIFFHLRFHQHQHQSTSINISQYQTNSTKLKNLDHFQNQTGRQHDQLILNYPKFTLFARRSVQVFPAIIDQVTNLNLMFASLILDIFLLVISHLEL